VQFGYDAVQLPGYLDQLGQLRLGQGLAQIFEGHASISVSMPLT
jgi:hypothetical protein